MGERTFSANDVLRIVADHLDRDEQETVRDFFLQPSEINSEILRRLLDLFTNFIPIFTTPLVGLIVSLLPGNASFIYNELVGELFTVRGRINREQERIDA